MSRWRARRPPFLVTSFPLEIDSGPLPHREPKGSDAFLVERIFLGIPAKDDASSGLSIPGEDERSWLNKKMSI